MFTFGDALRGAVGVYLDKSQVHMGTRMVRDRCQDLGQFRLRRGEGRRGIGHKEISALDHVRARRFDERVDIAGIGNKPVCINVSGLEELPPAMMEIRTLRSS